MIYKRKNRTFQEAMLFATNQSFSRTNAFCYQPEFMKEMGLICLKKEPSIQKNRVSF